MQSPSQAAGPLPKLRQRTEMVPELMYSALASTDRLLALGSCFAAEMGQRLIDHKFQCVLNPLGIVFHPLVMARQLARAQALVAQGLALQPHEAVAHEGLWHSWWHHGSHAQPSYETLQDAFAQSMRALHTAWQHSDALLLTFGTAWGYWLRADAPLATPNPGQWVANCHKQPAGWFDRQQVPHSEIEAAWLPLLSAWLAARPQRRIILSISPVRHGRDGLVANNQSKAQLLLAVHQLVASLGPQAAAHQGEVLYFPAYELLLDDLRDYRYYAPDLLHPSPTALDFIWQHFLRACFTPEAQETARAVHTLRAQAAHRPLHPHSAAHATQRSQLRARIQAWAAAHPHQNWQPELDALGEPAG